MCRTFSTFHQANRYEKSNLIIFTIYGDTHGFSSVSPIKKKIIQKWSKLQKRFAMSWNEWKINFVIFSFRVMVDFVLKNHRKIDLRTTIFQKLKTATVYSTVVNNELRNMPLTLISVARVLNPKACVGVKPPNWSSLGRKRLYNCDWTIQPRTICPNWPL